MTELTISANEITDALRKHVTEYNPTVAPNSRPCGRGR